MNEISRSSKKSRQREQLILAMLEQPTLEKAAASIGISSVTAWRIRKTPEFQEEYLRARREAVSQSFGRLQQGCGAAASTLLQIMDDPNTPAAIRVRAADTILGHAKDLLEVEDLAMRVQRLEQVITDNEEANNASQDALTG